jgi:hypothetical protein
MSDDSMDPRDIIHESRKRLNSIGPDIVEFGNQLLSGLDDEERQRISLHLKALEIYETGLTFSAITAVDRGRGSFAKKFP